MFFRQIARVGWRCVEKRMVIPLEKEVSRRFFELRIVTHLS